jgi:hypothetical protein
MRRCSKRLTEVLSTPNALLIDEIVRLFIPQRRKCVTEENRPSSGR